MSAEAIEREISKLKRDVELLKNIVAENHELSAEAIVALEAARKTPISEYKNLE